MKIDQPNYKATLRWENLAQVKEELDGLDRTNILSVLYC